jgi:branched-chain amino acid transport system ATP-binding protein
MLAIKNLTVAYGLHQALHGASLTVAAGEIVVMLGANGAGKSSLLRAIAAMSEGEVSGEITLDGTDLSALRPHQMVDAGIAFVPEGRTLFGDLSVRENLDLGAYSPRARDHRATHLDKVFTLFPRLAERRQQIARTMSGGEQQMVAIGRALMSNPKILMLDEPSLGLSPILCKDLFTTIARIREEGMGILLVEQNARQSLTIADRCHLLENGRITKSDTAQAMLHDPAVQAAYLGGTG